MIGDVIFVNTDSRLSDLNRLAQSLKSFDFSSPKWSHVGMRASKYFAMHAMPSPTNCEFIHLTELLSSSDDFRVFRHISQAQGAQEINSKQCAIKDLLCKYVLTEYSFVGAGRQVIDPSEKNDASVNEICSTLVADVIRKSELDESLPYGKVIFTPLNLYIALLDSGQWIDVSAEYGIFNTKSKIYKLVDSTLADATPFLEILALARTELNYIYRRTHGSIFGYSPKKKKPYQALKLALKAKKTISKTLSLKQQQDFILTLSILNQEDKIIFYKIIAMFISDFAAEGKSPSDINKLFYSGSILDDFEKERRVARLLEPVDFGGKYVGIDAVKYCDEEAMAIFLKSGYQSTDDIVYSAGAELTDMPENKLLITLRTKNIDDYYPIWVIKVHADS